MRHKQCRADSINGTSLKGYITTTYDDLCKTFGAPTIFVGDKTNAEWFIEFEDGSVATILFISGTVCVINGNLA